MMGPLLKFVHVLDKYRQLTTPKSRIRSKHAAESVLPLESSMTLRPVMASKATRLRALALYKELHRLGRDYEPSYALIL
jgi:hypothetical protein